MDEQQQNETPKTPPETPVTPSTPATTPAVTPAENTPINESSTTTPSEPPKKSQTKLIAIVIIIIALAALGYYAYAYFLAPSEEPAISQPDIVEEKDEIAFELSEDFEAAFDTCEAGYSETISAMIMNMKYAIEGMENNKCKITVTVVSSMDESVMPVGTDMVCYFDNDKSFKEVQEEVNPEDVCEGPLVAITSGAPAADEEIVEEEEDEPAKVTRKDKTEEDTAVEPGTPDVSHCLLLESLEKEKCIKEIAIENKDPKICDLMDLPPSRISQTEEECYIETAFLNNDVEQCKYLEEANMNNLAVKYDCYIAFALEKTDDSYCDYIDNEEYQLDCERRTEVRIDHPDFNLNSLKDSTWKSIARNTEDSSYCEYLDSSFYKDECLEYFE